MAFQLPKYINSNSSQSFKSVKAQEEEEALVAAARAGDIDGEVARINEVSSDEEEPADFEPGAEETIEEALKRGLNFYPRNQNLDMGAYEAYNEVGGSQKKEQVDDEEDQEANEVAANAGKLDLDDDLNLLQQQIMSIDENLDYGPEDLQGQEDYLDQSFDEEMMGMHGAGGQELNPNEQEFEQQLQEQIRMDQLLMEKARFKQQINQISSEVGRQLDSDIVNGNEINFTDPMGYNHGQPGDYDESDFGQVRDGHDLDDSSRISNPNKKEVAGIYERNQNQNFQRLFMGAKASFDLNKYQPPQPEQPVAVSGQNTNMSQELESDTVVEAEDLKHSALVLGSNQASAPQIAKNIDGQTTLRTYQQHSSSEVLPGMAQKNSVKSGSLAHLDRILSKEQIDEEEEQDQDDQPQFMQQLNTVVKYNQSESKLDANSQQDGQTSGGLRISGIEQQSSNFGPGHPYFTQGNSVVVMSSRQDGGMSNQESSNLLQLPNQLKNVPSAQYIDDEMYEISSTKKSQDHPANQNDEELTQNEEIVASILTQNEQSVRQQYRDLGKEKDGEDTQSQSTTFRDRKKKQEKLIELKSQFAQQLNNFKRRKEDLLSFDKMKEQGNNDPIIQSAKVAYISRGSIQQSSKQILASETANLTLTSDSDETKRGEKEINKEIEEQEQNVVGSGTINEEIDEDNEESAEQNDTPITQPLAGVQDSEYICAQQQSHPKRNQSEIKKQNSLSAIKNQLDLTMSQYGSIIRENIKSRLPCIDDESCDENDEGDSQLFRQRMDDQISSNIDPEAVDMRIEPAQIGQTFQPASSRIQAASANRQGTQGSQPYVETQRDEDQSLKEVEKGLAEHGLQMKSAALTQIPTSQDPFTLQFQPLSSCLKYSENSNEILPNGFQLSELVQSQVGLTNQVSDSNFLNKIPGADDQLSKAQQQQDNLDQILAHQLNLQDRTSSIMAHEVDTNEIFNENGLDNGDDLEENPFISEMPSQIDLCFQGNQGNTQIQPTPHSQKVEKDKANGKPGAGSTKSVHYQTNPRRKQRGSSKDRIKSDQQHQESNKTEKIQKKVRIHNEAKPPLAGKSESQVQSQDTSFQPPSIDKEMAKQQLFALLMDNQKKIQQMQAIVEQQRLQKVQEDKSLLLQQQQSLMIQPRKSSKLTRNGPNQTHRQPSIGMTHRSFQRTNRSKDRNRSVHSLRRQSNVQTQARKAQQSTALVVNPAFSELQDVKSTMARSSKEFAEAFMHATFATTKNTNKSQLMMRQSSGMGVSMATNALQRNNMKNAFNSHSTNVKEGRKINTTSQMSQNQIQTALTQVRKMDSLNQICAQQSQQLRPSTSVLKATSKQGGTKQANQSQQKIRQKSRINLQSQNAVWNKSVTALGVDIKRRSPSKQSRASSQVKKKAQSISQLKKKLSMGQMMQGTRDAIRSMGENLQGRSFHASKKSINTQRQPALLPPQSVSIDHLHVPANLPMQVHTQAGNLSLVQMTSSESRQNSRKASHQQYHSQHGMSNMVMDAMPHTVKNQQQSTLLRAQDKSLKRRKSPKMTSIGHVDSGTCDSFIQRQPDLGQVHSALSNENLANCLSQDNNQFMADNQQVDQSNFSSANQMMSLALSSKMPKIMINQKKNGTLFQKKLAKTDPVTRYQTLQNDRKKLMQKKKMLQQAMKSGQAAVNGVPEHRKSADKQVGLSMIQPPQISGVLTEAPSALMNKHHSGKKKLALTNRVSYSTNKSLMAVEQRGGSIFNLQLPSGQAQSSAQQPFVNCGVQEYSFDQNGNLINQEKYQQIR